MSARSRIVSQWYGTSLPRVLAWTAGIALVVYMLASLGEFVAAAAKAVTP